jgi:Tol biopolymer transport system component
MRHRTKLTTALVAGLVVVPAQAAGIAHRTVLLTAAPGGAPLAAPVDSAALAGNGAAVAFATSAPSFVPGDVNGGITDVFRADIGGADRRLVSEAYDGTGANGPSGTPAISDNGLTVAYASLASNLVPGDTDDAEDVFVRTRDGATQLVSVAADGGPANGGSSEPDISADGRIVAFTSTASNLVPGDTNGRADVFVRDLARQTTKRVSLSSTGEQGDGASSSPALDADGSAVAFESSARNLVPDDTNKAADVFVHEAGGVTERVSVSTSGKQQDRAIAAPFRAAPDISGDGRYVVFDTDATSLSASDTNARTDVYLRDRRRRRTTLVSASSLNVQGNNDSITPRITPNGRFVTFESFATNLVPQDGPREDLFVRDLRAGTTALVNATDSGARRQPEPVKQLLQPALVSDDARTAVFISGASNIIAPAAAPPSRELFVRRLAAPKVRAVAPAKRSGGMVRLRVTANDPAAKRFLCRVDQAVAFNCGPRISVRRTAGKLLRIRAGGPGMLWSAAIVVPLG